MLCRLWEYMHFLFLFQCINVYAHSVQPCVNILSLILLSQYFKVPFNHFPKIWFLMGKHHYYIQCMACQTYSRLCACVHVCVYLYPVYTMCVHTCTCVCVCVWLYVYVSCTYTHKNTCAYTHTHTHTWYTQETQIHTHTSMTHTHTHTHTKKHKWLESW